MPGVHESIIDRPCNIGPPQLSSSSGTVQRARRQNTVSHDPTPHPGWNPPSLIRSHNATLQPLFTLVKPSLVSITIILLLVQLVPLVSCGMKWHHPSWLITNALLMPPLPLVRTRIKHHCAFHQRTSLLSYPNPVLIALHSFSDHQNVNGHFFCCVCSS